MINDNDILSARKDEALLEELIRQNEALILRTASSVCKRYITRGDDQWSIALQAFVESVYDYRPGTGDFTGFACLVIRRRLIDYERSQARYRAETPHAPQDFEGSARASETGGGYELALKSSVRYDGNITLEIEAVSEIFARYGFTFFDLADCSPKSMKTKKNCSIAAAYILKNPVLLHELRASGQLPLKIIEKNTNVPRKILERHRRYIIAAVEIVSGDYPLLAEYMHGVRKEMDR